MPENSYSLLPPPKYSVAAILALAAGVGSMVVGCSGHPGRGLLLAIVSLPFALFGLLRSITPGIRGLWLSLSALAIGACGIVVCLLAWLLHIVW